MSFPLKTVLWNCQQIYERLMSSKLQVLMFFSWLYILPHPLLFVCVVVLVLSWSCVRDIRNSRRYILFIPLYLLTWRTYLNHSKRGKVTQQLLSIKTRKHTFTKILLTKIQHISELWVVWNTLKTLSKYQDHELTWHYLKTVWEYSFQLFNLFRCVTMK